MVDRRKIAIFTSTRADYGLLRWTLQALHEDDRAELQVIVTGTHLASGYGHTIDSIHADGFPIADEIPMNVENDDGYSAAAAAATVMHGVANTLRSLGSDILVVLGDRYETLAAVQAAYLARTPVAHIHGGEVTTGAFDDGIRHAITKLARLHLTSTEAHRRRVLQLGEDPAWVHVVGAPGLENLLRLRADDRSSFERRIGRTLGSPAILLTYHPATAVDEDPGLSMATIINALDLFPKATIIATGSNADPGAREAMAVLEEAARHRAGRVVIFESLGAQGYRSALAHCDVVVGNSSSGIIEAPSAGIPTVNIGARQGGRPRGPSIIDCDVEVGAIRAATERALTPAFRSIAARRENPYAGERPDVGRAIADKILTADLLALKAAKPFVDIAVPL